MQLCTIPFLPESPRWLVATGKELKARQVILAICDAESFESSDVATSMLANIQQAVEMENDNNPTYKELFVTGPFQYSRRVLLAFGLQAMQQLSGISEHQIEVFSTD